MLLPPRGDLCLAIAKAVIFWVFFFPGTFFLFTYSFIIIFILLPMPAPREVLSEHKNRCTLIYSYCSESSETPALEKSPNSLHQHKNIFNPNRTGARYRLKSSHDERFSLQRGAAHGHARSGFIVISSNFITSYQAATLNVKTLSHSYLMQDCP